MNETKYTQAPWENVLEIGEKTLYQHVVTEHDWPEDFSEENGNYTCTCISCGTFFIGYKRRIVCKYCACLGARHSKTALSPETREMLRAYAIERMRRKRSKIVAEERLERSLRSREAVHHINGIITDNRLGNLIIVRIDS